MNLPNLFTKFYLDKEKDIVVKIFRIILVPIMVIIPFLGITGTISGIPISWIIIDLIFILASITDKLDGYLARKNNQITTFGKFLDPLADKILVLAAMTMLVEMTKLPAWIPIIVLTREFMVSGYRLVAVEKGGKVIAASKWGKLKTDDNYLFEMLILETFQIGLSWECVLNKREAFKKAYNNFDLDKVCNYNDNKIKELESNPNIIRNKSKIKASINNAKIFKSIKEEYHSFYNYLKTFTNNKIIYERNKTTSSLSDKISKDLKKRGMKFVGSVIIYSYLQAIGIIYSHDKECFLYKKK